MPLIKSSQILLLPKGAKLSPHSHARGGCRLFEWGVTPQTPHSRARGGCHLFKWGGPPKPPTPAPGVNVDTFLATPDMSKHLTFHYRYAKTLYLVTPGNIWQHLVTPCQNMATYGHTKQNNFAILPTPKHYTWSHLVTPGNTWSPPGNTWSHPGNTWQHLVTTNCQHADRNCDLYSGATFKI